EPAVRVPVGALRFTGLVFDLTHLVQVDERIEVGRADPGEGADHRETLALVTAGAGGDGPHRAFCLTRCGGSNTRQADRVSGDSRHVTNNRTTVRLIPDAT